MATEEAVDQTVGGEASSDDTEPMEQNQLDEMETFFSETAEQGYDEPDYLGTESDDEVTEESTTAAESETATPPQEETSKEAESKGEEPDQSTQSEESASTSTESETKPEESEEGKQPESPSIEEPQQQATQEGEQPNYEELRTNALSELEERYKFSEEDENAFTSEPEKVLPKMAARVYMDAFESISRSLTAQLPQMVDNVIRQREVQRQSADKFYSRWDKLDRNDQRVQQLVGQTYNVYRQLNPRATEEEAIRDVGMQVMTALGIPLVDDQTQDEPEPVRQQTPPPHVPAKPSGSPPPRGGQSGNQFETLSEELFDDDE